MKEAVFGPRCGSDIAGGDGPPLLEPGPWALDHRERCSRSIGIGPGGAGNRRLMPLRRDHRPAAQVPDVPSKGMAGGAAVRHHPAWHAGRLWSSSWAVQVPG